MADLSEDELQELIRLCFPAAGEWDEAKCALRLHVSAPRLLSELQRRRADDAVREEEREELARLRDVLANEHATRVAYHALRDGDDSDTKTVARQRWASAMVEHLIEARRCHELKGGA